MRLDDQDGRFVAWADMFYPGVGLVVEYDGQQHRTDDVQYRRDVDRLDAIRALGHGIVRIDRTLLDPGRPSPAAALRVERALRARGWPDRPAL
ncbi:MAG: hypothetical protein Q7T71_12105 [Herbiconiux sp.]|nr:hypothetical protein [Herbiconiux sp.]